MDNFGHAAYIKFLKIALRCSYTHLCRKKKTLVLLNIDSYGRQYQAGRGLVLFAGLEMPGPEVDPPVPETTAQSTPPPSSAVVPAVLLETTTTLAVLDLYHLEREREIT